MKHLHKKSGQVFEVGSYISPDDNKTYDITIISYWKDPEQEKVGSPVEIVGYYFGGYDQDDTDYYIDRWLENRNREISALQTAHKYLSDYLEVDREFFELHTVTQLDKCIKDCQLLLADRNWEFEIKPGSYPRTRDEYLQYIEHLYSEDKIDDDAMDALVKLASNYPTSI